MDYKSFYNNLWSVKRQADYRPTVRRDWFHRFVLDPIFDPTANPRHEVALSLLHGGQRLLDIGCWNGYLLERIREVGLYQELYGVDVVPEAVEAVRAKGFQAQVVDLNLDPFPFPDGYFDGITIFTNRLRILFGRVPVTSQDPGWDGGTCTISPNTLWTGF